MLARVLFLEVGHHLLHALEFSTHLEMRFLDGRRAGVIFLVAELHIGVELLGTLLEASVELFGTSAHPSVELFGALTHAGVELLVGNLDGAGDSGSHRRLTFTTDRIGGGSPLGERSADRGRYGLFAVLGGMAGRGPPEQQVESHETDGDGEEQDEEKCKLIHVGNSREGV